MAYLSSPSFAPLAAPRTAPGLFARALQAISESRMRAARRELHARGHLVNETALVLGDVRSRTAARPFDR